MLHLTSTWSSSAWCCLHHLFRVLALSLPPSYTIWHIPLPHGFHTSCLLLLSILWIPFIYNPLTIFLCSWISGLYFHPKFHCHALFFLIPWQPVELWLQHMSIIPSLYWEHPSHCRQNADSVHTFQILEEGRVLPCKMSLLCFTSWFGGSLNQIESSTIWIHKEFWANTFPEFLEIKLHIHKIKQRKHICHFSLFQIYIEYFKILKCLSEWICIWPASKVNNCSFLP